MLKAVGSALKSVGWGNATTVGVGGFFALDSYQEAREQGDSALWAGTKAATDFALPFMLSMPMYFAYEGITSLPGMVVDGHDYYRQASRQAAVEKRNAAFAGAQFNDSEQAYTMRQAGMAMAERSRYNVQQARLGNEAKYMLR